MRIFDAIDTGRFHQLEFSLGERAGFVRAENVHAAKILDGRQVLYDYAFFGHGESAIGESNGHDHRQQFRRKSDGNRQCK